MNSSLRIPFLVALCTVALHLIVNAAGHYGYFRDELYYIVSTRHLDWGFIDHPPLSIAILALNRLVFGDSLFALRLLPAIIGGAVVFLTAILARDFGGGRAAQTNAAITSAVTPLILAVTSFYSMNTWDLLFTLLCSLLLFRALHEEGLISWVAFGIIAGLGVQNKYSVLFLCVGFALGILLSPERRVFRRSYVWIAVGIAAACSVPHLAWQIHHGFPSLEFINNARLYKNTPVSPIDFLLGLLITMGPLNVLIWLPGLWFLLASRGDTRLRPFGVAFVSLLLLYMLQRGKTYYMGPVFPLLFAAGAVAIEQWTELRRWIRPTILVPIVTAGFAVLPLALPILPVDLFIRYQAGLGITPPREERSAVGVLPQLYADQFGWKEKAEAVARAYNRLTAVEQSECAIFADNYGRAAALDFFGRPLGLPASTSRHNSYWMWGPGTASGKVVIILGGRREDHLRGFEQVEDVEEVVCDYCMPYENHLHVYICRNLKVPMSDLWPTLKLFI
jgi:hypothetical protein